VSDGVYFDSALGWVTPSDFHESETPKSLKEVMAALEGGAADAGIYDAAERLLWKYSVLIKAGVRESMGGLHKNVSWYISEGCEGRAVIAYQDGTHAEWAHGCYADEVPLWLLVGLFRRIARRKPLGDQEADETISRVDEIDAEYVRSEAMRDLEKQFRLTKRGPP
jgi:hypothetical protein